VFHVSLLETYRQATVAGRSLPDLDGVLENTENVVPTNKFLPLRIHNSARKCREGKLKIHYLVEWDGWPNVWDYTWDLMRISKTGFAIRENFWLG